MGYLFRKKKDDDRIFKSLVSTNKANKVLVLVSTSTLLALWHFFLFFLNATLHKKYHLFSGDFKNIYKTDPKNSGHKTIIFVDHTNCGRDLTHNTQCSRKNVCSLGQRGCSWVIAIFGYSRLYSGAAAPLLQGDSGGSN